MDCRVENNLVKCNCTYKPCLRKGKCCECIAYHLKAEELSACCFPKEIESTYDRSIVRFVQYKTGRIKNFKV